MKLSNLTARELYDSIKKTPTRPHLGFGKKPILINVDPQKAYTRPELFVTAYETNPRQMEYINQLAKQFRQLNLPVVWTYVAYMESGEDCGVWGTRSNTPDSLQNIKHSSERAAFDDRLHINETKDIIINKHMASAFFETNLRSLMTWHGCDSALITGGSTSGRVRATVVDCISNGFHAIIPEECVADKHESPHFANLYDMAMKYADVVSVNEIFTYLEKIDKQ